MSHKFDEKYSFDINEDGNRRKFYFRFENGQPLKRGDGTFGAVYEIEDDRNQRFAVKLLYSSRTLPQIGELRLTEQIIADFRRHFRIKEDDPILQKIEILKQVPEDLSLFVTNFMELELTGTRSRFLFEEIQKKSRSIALQRFKFEIESAKRIRKELNQRNLQELFAGIINVEGGTELFHSYPAYESLKETFKESQLEVSNYALVMPLYDSNLKELLESGIGKFSIRSTAIEELFPTGHIPAPQLQLLMNEPLSKETTLKDAIQKTEGLSPKQKSILQENIYELTGYDLLASMNFELRIRTILPYLLNIAQGIRALHVTGLYHHDLKPANIFVKDEGGAVNAVVGDLGFLMTQNLASTMKTSQEDVLPLGTRHYRSPEQKDYFDICDVEIAHQALNEAGHKQVVLIVADPKFHDSIIEPGDDLVFSKDSKRRYRIAELKKNKNSTSTMITLEGDQKQLLERLKPEKQTQVILYKRPATRTDLFGLGAIIFDLLTCGESPERFYDGIRSYDLEEYSVDRIMDSYRQVSNYQTYEPGLIPIFAPFKHQQNATYAPDELVELILKCMLYKADNTFYRAYALDRDDLNNEKAVEAVFTELKRLESKYPSLRFNNPLLKRIFTRPTQQDTSVVSEKIDKLQLLPLPKVPLRLAHGIWYFRKLVELVRRTMGDKSTAFFAEMLPKNITKQDEKLEFFYTAFRTERAYQDDLRQDRVYTKITRDITNPYVPNYLTFMRRYIQLEKVPDKINTFRYTFTDSSLLGDDVLPGDWIVVNNSNELWQIKSVTNHELILDTADQPEGGQVELELVDEQERYVYYRNLEPCHYYLSMLGIYLYQIFFVGLGHSTVDKPVMINFAQNAVQLYGQAAVQIKKRKGEDPLKQFEKEKDPLKYIFQFITRMYLRLTFSENEDSYYHTGDNDRSRILAVQEDTEALQSMIEDFVGVIKGELDELIPENRLNQKGPYHLEEGLEFNKLVNSLMTLSTSANGWVISTKFSSLSTMLSRSK